MTGNKEDINLEYNENTGMCTFTGEITNNSENDPSFSLGNSELDSFNFYNEFIPIFDDGKKQQKIISDKEHKWWWAIYSFKRPKYKNGNKIRNKNINQKRGRVRKSLKKEKSKAHDRNTIDNLLRKVQVHYLTFITTFLNNALNILNKGKKFQKLDYKYKRNIKKTFVNSLKIKNIGDIIRTEISEKYKKFDKDYNKALFEEYKKDEILSELFKKQYLVLFKKIYYRNKKK